MKEGWGGDGEGMGWEGDGNGMGRRWDGDGMGGGGVRGGGMVRGMLDQRSYIFFFFFSVFEMEMEMEMEGSESGVYVGDWCLKRNKGERKFLVVFSIFYFVLFLN